jgi:DNA adenine methylase
VERATRFIYLNRTCFGGLHRTNRSGQFNVPFGGGDRTPEPVYRDHLLRSAAQALRRKDIRLAAGDFQPLVQRAGPGDVVFCDPTYRSAGLARAVTAAFARGAVCIVMNVDDPDVASLYSRATVVHVAKAKCIGNRPKNDGRHREIIAGLDPHERNELWLSVRVPGAIPAAAGAPLALSGAA